jgi:DNA-directed RNA polymerase specialized sigma54-like protein
MKDGAKNATGDSWTRTFWCRTQDLQECLLLQLKNKTHTESVELAIIIENQFDAFTKNITTN